VAAVGLVLNALLARANDPGLAALLHVFCGGQESRALTTNSSQPLPAPAIQIPLGDEEGAKAGSSGCLGHPPLLVGRTAFLHLLLGRRHRPTLHIRCHGQCHQLLRAEFEEGPSIALPGQPFQGLLDGSGISGDDLRNPLAVGLLLRLAERGTVLPGLAEGRA
jgi:hypothetical protein